MVCKNSMQKKKRKKEGSGIKNHWPTNGLIQAE